MSQQALDNLSDLPRGSTDERPRFAGGTWITLALIIAFAVGVRWRLREMPLERDEGEFAYAAQLLLQGHAPYDGAYSQKFPGVPVAYAAFFLAFGQTISAVHIGAILINAGCIAFLFLLVRRFCNDYAAILAAGCYCLLTLDQSSLGMAGHATHFVVLFALAGLLILLWSLDRNNRSTPLWAGLCLGLATLMKQPGAVFTPLAVVWVIVHHLMSRPFRWRLMLTQIVTLGAGVLFPIAMSGFALWKSHVLSTGWFWTVTYARKFGSVVPMNEIGGELRSGFNQIAVYTHTLWWLAGICALLMWFTRKCGRAAIFAALLLIFSFAGTSFGWMYRNHYFILVMPAISMMIGIGLSAMRGWLRRWSPVAALVIPLAICVSAWARVVWLERGYLFEMTPIEACHATYGINPFVESIDIGKYIDAHSSPNERIAVLGSEAEIFFYSKRMSATGYLYMYPLMEPQPFALKMQKEMAGEIEAAHPAYVVLVNIPTSWLPRPNAEPWILQWTGRFLAGYERVGLLELTRTGWHSYWDDAARNHALTSPVYVEILKPKTQSDTGFRL